MRANPERIPDVQSLDAANKPDLTSARRFSVAPMIDWSNSPEK